MRNRLVLIPLITLAALAWTVPILTWDPPIAAALPTQQTKRYAPPPSHDDCLRWQWWLDHGYTPEYNYYGSWWRLPDGSVINSSWRNECVDTYGYNGRVK